MSVIFCVIVTAFLLAVVGRAANDDDVRGDYLFLLHEDNNLLLAEKDRNCYFLSINDLKAHALYSASQPETEDNVIMILNGTRAADITATTEDAINGKYNDDFASMFCQGYPLYDVQVIGPTEPPCVDVYAGNCTIDFHGDCDSLFLHAVCRRSCNLCTPMSGSIVG